MSLSTVVFAGATDTQAPSPADAAAALAVETALRQPMDVQTHEALMQNDTLFEQVLIDEQIVQEEDGTRGILRTYNFVPKFQTRGISNTCYPMVEYVANNNDSKHARLYATFTFNGISASCIERSTDCNLNQYKEKSLTISGNGTTKSTVKLEYSWMTIRNSQDSILSITCDKNGSITTKK